MKFNKYQLSHYFVFLVSIIILLIAFLTKIFKKQLNNKNVILYGHKLYGNLKAIYKNKSDINSEVFYLTLDKKYYNLLKQENINVLYGLRLKDVFKVVNCKIFICDHGLHFYKILMSLKPKPGYKATIKNTIEKVIPKDFVEDISTLEYLTDFFIHLNYIQIRPFLIIFLSSLVLQVSSFYFDMILNLQG